MKMYFIKGKFYGETLTTSKDFFEDILSNCLYESFDYENDKDEDETFKTEYNNVLGIIYTGGTFEVDNIRFSIVSKNLVLKED